MVMVMDVLSRLLGWTLLETKTEILLLKQKQVPSSPIQPKVELQLLEVWGGMAWGTYVERFLFFIPVPTYPLLRMARLPPFCPGSKLQSLVPSLPLNHLFQETKLEEEGKKGSM